MSPPPPRPPGMLSQHRRQCKYGLGDTLFAPASCFSSDLVQSCEAGPAVSVSVVVAWWRLALLYVFSKSRLCEKRGANSRPKDSRGRSRSALTFKASSLWEGESESE